VLDRLAALAKIAEIDAEALRTDTELADIPARLLELDQNVKKLGELLEAEKQELRDADALVATADGEIQTQSQNLAKSKAKGARARTTREADAVERELEVIRRQTKEREEERETLKAAIVKRRASVEKHEKEYSELQTFTAEERQRGETRLAELQKVRDGVIAGRRELAELIPKDTLRRYELIRDKRGGIGAVAVKGGICAGCHTSLPPQQKIAVTRGETFEQCPRCQRFLFSPEALKKFAEDGQTTPSA
jgi:predicted  nucleic acid-binding Zn-ribbon protein